MNVNGNLTEARHFLSLIAPDDQITFQTFGEGGHKANSKLTRVFHGRLDDNSPELVSLNQQGAGVFFMINRGDGRGRKAENITAVRAIFVDLDENGQEKLEKLSRLTAGAPRLIVESSPRKYHCYWRIGGCLPLEYFSPIQKHFALQFGGDPAVSDLPRVMRLPGFYHLKEEPFLTRIILDNPEAKPLPARLLLEKVKSLLSESSPKAVRTTPLNSDFQINQTSKLLPSWIGEALNHIPPEPYEEWLKVGMALHCRTEGSVAGLQAWIAWSRNPLNFDEEACKAKWATFGESGRPEVTIGTIHHLAQENGWVGPQGEHLTDVGNGQRLVRNFGDNLRYVPEMGRWLIYENGLWRQDTDGEITRFGKRTTDQIVQEARKIADDEQRQRLMKHAIASESCHRLEAMIKMAATEKKVVLHQKDIDRDPDLFGLSGGVLNLKTGKVQPGRREEYITKRADIAAIPEDVVSLCPSWLNFLERIMEGDRDLIQYLQRAMGYSLTGHTSEQCLFFLYGTGANGKSTFLNVLQALLGDYALVIDPETLMSKASGGGATPELARLTGARVLITNEVEEGKRLAENRVKQMTGGDTMVARHLYQMPFEFKPKFKIWMAGNHKPVIRGTDHAIWRRIHLVPFAVSIPKEEQDKSLAKKLRAEMSGILQWAVEGCKEWRNQGLKAPKQVKAAVDGYREEMDILGHWIEECCVLNERIKAESNHLYQSYKSWCQLNGHYFQSQTRFGRALGERGLQKEKQGTISWTGIGLKPASEIRRYP
jgi:putative DNA primase/helicase